MSNLSKSQNSTHALPLIIRSDPKRLILSGGFGLIFILIGVFLLMSEPLRPTIWRQITQPIIGILGIAFGLIAIIWVIYLRNKVILSLTDDGLLFQGGRFVPWSALKGMDAEHLFNGWYATFMLHEGASEHTANGSHFSFGFGAVSDRDFALAEKIISEKLRSMNG